jgi:uncharacterized membrane-anchored protein
MSLLFWAALALAQPALEADAPFDAEAVAAENGIKLAPADDPRVQEMIDWSEGRGNPETEMTMRYLVQMERDLPFEKGDVTIAGGAVRLELGDDLVYLPPSETSTVLEDWGNGPGIQTHGMIKPADGFLYGPDSWAVILQYEEDGWIDDADAASIDYDEMLVQMRSDNAAQNEARAAQGLDSMSLKGWAEPPHYDPVTKRLYWAKAFDDGSGEGTLNYDVRTLGRYGVLSMNAVAGLEMLTDIKGEMSTVRDVAHFTEGNRYADYVPGSDKAATYGMAALVAGGAGAAAMKGGLFKGLIAMLLAGKKLVVVAFVGLLAGVKAMFSRGKSED